MAVRTRTSEFTGNDAAAWPLSSGAWTHATEIVTVASPANTIVSNQGRTSVGSGTTLGALRTHQIDHSGHQGLNGEIRVKVTNRSSNNFVGPQLCLRHQSLIPGGERLFFRLYYAQVGKTTAHWFHMGQQGATTQTLVIDSTKGWSGTSTDIWMAFRVIDLAFTTLVQGKHWLTTDPEPSWATPENPAPSGSSLHALHTGLFNLPGSASIGEFYGTDPTATTTLDWDDLTVTFDDEQASLDVLTVGGT